MKITSKSQFSCFKQASDLNYSDALYNLSVCYKMGYGLEENSKMSFELCSKASQMGNTNAMVCLALCYEIGDSCQKDMKQTFQLMEKAARLGNPEAIFNLGVFTQNVFYGQINLNKSFLHFSKAASYCHIDSMYQCYLCFLKGAGVQRNLQKAIDFLKIVAEKEINFALHEYGFILLNGIEHFLSKNEQKANECFQKSLFLHFQEGIFWSGYCLIEGIGIEKKFYSGVELIRQAFDNHFFLSELYLPTIEQTRKSIK